MIYLVSEDIKDEISAGFWSVVGSMDRSENWGR